MKKRCPRCGTPKHPWEFNDSKATGDDVNAFCRRCREPYLKPDIPRPRKVEDQILKSTIVDNAPDPRPKTSMSHYGFTELGRKQPETMS